MSEQKAVETISMEKVLGGLGLLNPRHATEFDVSLKTGAATPGHVAWVQKMLPSWEDFLNTNSGARVISSTVNVEGKIVVRMVIKGGVCTDRITDADIGKMIPGQVRKILAEKILRDFPVTFEARYPYFCAEVTDTYFVFPGRDGVSWTEERLEEMRKEKTKEIIEEVLTAFKAKLFKICIPGKAGKYFIEPCKIIVTWEDDISQEVREALRALFERELRSVCHNKIFCSLSEKTKG